MGTHALDTFIAKHAFALAQSEPIIARATTFAAEGLGIALLIGVVIFLFSHEHKRAGLYNVAVVLVSGFSAYMVSAVLKYAIERPRPLIALADIDALVPYVGAYQSFPSGHTTFFAAIATAIFFYHPKAGMFLYILTALIAAARITAGVHWFTDVVAGIFIGALVAGAIYGLARITLRRQV